ncbi:MAG TPA: peptidylprolyl isomerase [Candidatus Acidoferrales bacterium]|jgi:peptidyl-prolyl cis-trans isomerase A (cyclophilin A)|nr:peptidylprolyl isomerase [Candidatus Acidoferrales bacterium]
MRYVSGFAAAVLACSIFASGATAQTPAPAPAKKPAPAAKAPAAKAPAAKAPAARTTPYDPALLHPETLKAKAPAEYDVKFVTTAGDFTVHVTRAWAPNGADRFYNLVRHHFYDGSAFFRVLSGFMAQFGLSAYPEVSKVWENATIKDDPVAQSNHRGFVSFATAGPNTRTTQAFINFGNNEALDKSGFAAFAVVSDGMDVVDKLYNGYGEGAPDGHGPAQDLIGTRGHLYLEKSFPKLDIIRSATVVPAAPASAPAK